MGVLFLQFWLGLQGDQGKRNLEMSLAIGGCLRVFSVVRAGPAPALGGGRREVGREKGRERGGEGGIEGGRKGGRTGEYNSLIVFFSMVTLFPSYFQFGRFK